MAAVAGEHEDARAEQLLAHEGHEVMRAVDLRVPLADHLQPGLGLELG